MMKIIVNRFCLSHGGEIYKEGDVVEIADPQMAKRLVARSGGDLAIYHSDEAEDMAEDAADMDGENTEADDDDSGDVSDSDSDDGAGGIPPVDPTAAVETDSDSPKGKGKGKRK